MRRTSRQRRSPIMLSAVFIAGSLVEGARVNDLHTQVALAMQADTPLQAVQFVSMSVAEDVKMARAKCAHRGES
jgi:hypothetical protein